MKAFFSIPCRFAVTGLLILAALGLFSSASASLSTHLEISEICSSNKTVYLTETGESPDWIELKCAGGDGASLEGWYLSNDEDEPRLVSLADFQLNGNGRLILKADREELPFKLSSSGGTLCLTDSEGNTQTVSYPPLTSDQTYSLQPDGEWHVTKATPGAENAAGEPYVEPPFVAPPKFSHAAGFFYEPFDLTLTGYGDVKIYYTTDGSTPDENATLYTAPIHIENRSSEPNVWSAREDIQLSYDASEPPKFLVDKCSVIRAVSVDSAGNKSQVVTNSFFVGLEYDNIAVLSMVADPYDLFDKNDGIYVLGKCYYDWLNDPNQDHTAGDYYIPTNFGKTNSLSSREREVPANLQLFDKSGNVTLSQTLAIRIQGNYSRLRPQKSFKVTARKEISGDNRVALRLWDDLPKLKQLIVRADVNSVKTPSIDVFAQLMVSEQGMPYSHALPCIVFLDGEYWGLYNIRPSMNEDFISEITGIPEEKLMVVKNNVVKLGKEHFPVSSWRKYIETFSSLDCSKQADYEKMASIFDVESYARFVMCNLYLLNYDFKDTQNMTIWRTIETGDKPDALDNGRWRWIFQDMDLTCRTGEEDRVFNTILPGLNLFQMLWKNEGFREEALNILAEFANVDCSEGRVEKIISLYEDMYGDHIEATQARYSSPHNRTTQYMSKRLRKFFATQRETFWELFSDAMSITSPLYQVQVALDDASGISLQINNRNVICLDNHWTGQYYDGLKLSLRVSDIPRYRFLGWYEGDQLVSEDAELTFTVSGNRNLTPKYEALPLLLDISENRQPVVQDGLVFIPSNDKKVRAWVEADESLVLNAEGNLTVSAENKWPVDSGLTITWTPNKNKDLRLSTHVAATSDVPARWAVLWQVDENEWQTLHTFRLKEDDGPVYLDLTLPDVADEAQRISLRFASEKKGGKGSLILSGFAVSGSIEGTAEINELCSTNKASLLTENGTSPDWIELRNSGSERMVLDGWHLSSDDEELPQFSLDGIILGPQEYRLLHADGNELPFKLSSSGGTLCLTDSEGNTQTVSYPPLTSDQTYSLQPDGEWHVAKATPGAENAVGEPYVEPPFVAPPKFSQTAGFFNEPFDLTLTGYGDVKIYYTTDGSTPDENATFYTSPIHIENRSSEPNVWSAREDIQLTDLASAPPDFLVDKCSMIRAVAVDAAGNKSETITNTYFVDLKYDNIDTLSIVATPHDLFDKDDGIYVRGKIYTDWVNDPNQDHAVSDFYIPTNFGKTNPLSSREREIPADFQLFDASGNLLLNQTLTIRIQGNYSRMRPQKSFTATARKEVSGDGKIAVRLWDDLPKLKQIQVRADGNMTSSPSVDVFSHMIVSEQGQIASRAVPTIVFLAGEYWGLYNLRPSLDERYISAYTGIAEDNLIMVKNNQFKAGGENLPSYKSWNSLLRELGGKDFSKETEYQELTSLIDVDSYIRFTAANLYLQNRDMNDTQNVTMWRTIGQDGEGLNDGRWRWMYQDMDLTCELGYESKVFQEILPNLSMLKMLWNNPGFQRQFQDTLCDFMNVDCSDGRIEKLLQQYSEMYGPYILDTQLRYSSQFRRSTQQMVANIRQFFNNSRLNFLTQFADAMGIETPVCTLIADFSAADGVDLSVNNRRTLYLNQHWTGRYFAGSSLTLSVSDVPTYEFLGWYEGGTLLTEDHELTLTVTGDRTVAPRFQALPRILEMNEQKSAFPRWGKTNLVSNDFNIMATIDADDGLILDADTRAVLTAEGKWAADTGLTISWNTIQYNTMQLFMDAKVEGNAPSKWELLWSLDGNTWNTIAGFKLGEEKTSLHFSLPEEMNDISQAYLRLASEKKGKSGALTLENLAVCGQKQRFSLATVRYYIACLRNLLGDSYTPPDIDTLMLLTPVEISETEKKLKSQLTSELIEHNRSVVGQALSDVPQLQMFADCPVFDITDEIFGLSREEWVNAGGLPDGEAYLYRWEDGRLLLESTCTIEAGYFLMPLSPGVFVLTNSRFESKAYSVEVIRSALSQELVDKALGGLYPAPSYHLDVTLYAAGVDTIHLNALSDQAILPELWVYKIMPDHSLVFAGTAARNKDGSYDPPCAETGEYLLLTESLEDHLDEAEMRLRRLNPVN